MLNEPQIKRMISKLNWFATQLEPHIFEKRCELENVEFFHADKQYHTVPEDGFAPATNGMKWSGEGTYCWFKSDFTVPDSLDGKTLFVMPHIGGYEALLWVDGIPFGTFATKIVYTAHGNHYCDMIKSNAHAGDKIEIALEYYAGHLYPGCMPGDTFEIKDFTFDYNGIDICTKNYEVQDFYFDLCSLLEIEKNLPETSFRRGEVTDTLYEVYKILDITLDDTPFEEVMESVRKASPLLKASLAKKNGDSAPEAAIIGHSHMDTAWLWHVGETVKKCCRTYANQLNLMEQYPEYKFVQSSACHSDFIRRYYPQLFTRIQKAVADGRYEPNGGVWVECDCNITSGESMIRQFLWGQRFTRKYFDFTSNCFWLPDTFGYSAAIPQIMKGCGVDYFLTTKISWNDTNKFPYDTFYWQGIDGTKVFTHFNTTHHFPCPEDIIERIDGTEDGIKQRTVTNKRLLSFGFGDGGGGPQYEMCEFARRCEDTAGVPKTHYSLVGDFMKKLERDCKNPNTYRGELYLELHRGTLTNQHTIKRNNRKSEFALRDLEIAIVSDAVKKSEKCTSERTAPLYETLLVNQFHDILPGTCINRAHVESRAQTSALISSATKQTKELLGETDGDLITFTNTLSFDRNDCIFAPYREGYILEGDVRQQAYTALDGTKKLIVAGVTVPAFSSVTLKYVKGELSAKSAFKADGRSLVTPFAEVKFAENGTVSSFIDTRARRELVNETPFNTFMIAEDLPESWDNWDIDADIMDKFNPCSNLVSRETVSDGEAAYVVRSEYAISEKSTVKQDMFFFADSPEVRFDTAMDWNDDHRFLKTFFDTTVCDDFARHEIQFGCVKRPTTRNTSVEQAKFEVVNHKYTDISETSFGVSILNDCKYGISAEGGKLGLSLHKGGVHPDFAGDKDGIHVCTYSFLPHTGAFCAESVIRPAYELNVPVIETSGRASLENLVTVSAPNIFVEAVKPCEDGEKAYIVRMYEAEGTFTHAGVGFSDRACGIEETNMLEETVRELPLQKCCEFDFKPFEIKTVKVYYK